MAPWVDVSLVTGCDPPTTLGVAKLPRNAPDLVAARVLVRAGDHQRLLKVDYRSDGGSGA